MGRTNIDIDEELIQRAMQKYGLKTKREAVDLALRRLAGPELTKEILDSVTGIGWEGDLDEMRAAWLQKFDVSVEDDSIAQ